MFQSITTRFAPLAFLLAVACDDRSDDVDDRRSEQLMIVDDDVAVAPAATAPEAFDDAERLPLDDEDMTPECEDARIIAEDLHEPLDPEWLERNAVRWDESSVEFKPGITLTTDPGDGTVYALPHNTDPTSSIWCTCAGACGSSACEKIVTASSVTCQNPEGGCSDCGGSCVIGQKPKFGGLFMF